ncbi:hypothetical protein Kpho02_32820 [Kitasatospora phosalacinea]|uniref:DUF4015 domain-containing protein n=1 Tax=Kitasatospora phosalacinea TaxID=2065 RepID=A0A9W6V280_9ACTN|nr:hypothetical protein [Kitasatospora phosalacinea]GLW70983.1 hypothetical protein Kpho02_32820 [Kitasatospora phosalacinea]
MRSCYLLAPGSPLLPQLLDRAAAAGLDTVVTRLDGVTPGFADMARGRGLRVYGSFACFRGPDGPSTVDQDGRPWQPMEWYTGVRPNDPAWNARLADQLAAALHAAPVDGLLLDFLRWPLHWEWELRPGARPRSASYDPDTLRQFAELTGHHPPGTGATAARWIAAHHPAAWTEFRTAAVTRAARQFAAAARSARPGLPVGAFLVPAGTEAERRALVGQDARELALFLDLLLPMTYHAILHRPLDWPGRTAQALAAAVPADTAVVPVVQTTADATAVLAAPADWGKPFDAAEFAALLDLTAAAGSGSICLFPGEGLDPDRWDVLTDRAARPRPSSHPLEGPSRAR